MQFNSTVFIIFFLLFFAAHAVVVTYFGRSARLGLILVSSAIFYGAWDYRFLPLLFISIVIDYFLARGIAASNVKAAKRRLLIGSIGMNLGILAFFKYTNFFLENVRAVLAAVSLDVPIPEVDIILPVGISFYTFQSMSYTIDVYRGHYAATSSPAAFAASVSFFPQLVAGPIVRARELVPQMLDGPKVDWNQARIGLLLVSLGAFKKTVADLLGPVADRAFADPAAGLIESWTGALAFSGQIYGDFAGYTDIAIGLACLLGYTFPPNFRLPYIATSPSDFWRRWHISLSTWLRDYLYIPLGGNKSALYRNLLVTMLLGGLWHGASWTFVVWGFYHGCLLVGQRLLKNRMRVPSTWWAHVLSIGLMFYLTVIGWVFFRAETISDAFVMLRTMHVGTISSMGWEVVSTLSLVALAIVGTHGLDALAIKKGKRLSTLIVVTIAIAALAFSFVLGGSNYAFIYFQF